MHDLESEWPAHSQGRWKAREKPNTKTTQLHDNDDTDVR